MCGKDAWAGSQRQTASTAQFRVTAKDKKQNKRLRLFGHAERPGGKASGPDAIGLKFPKNLPQMPSGRLWVSVSGLVWGAEAPLLAAQPSSIAAQSRCCLTSVQVSTDISSRV